MQGCLYYTANEIMEMLGISRGHAYKIVKKLNDELSKKGFIVIAGRVPKKYFAEHYYGMEQRQQRDSHIKFVVFVFGKEVVI